VHTEEETRSDYYNSLYQFVAKTLKEGGFTKDPSCLNFPGLKSFQVGRP